LLNRHKISSSLGAEIERMWIPSRDGHTRCEGSTDWRRARCEDRKERKSLRMAQPNDVACRDNDND
jgi:hypothetical protein